MHTVNTYITKKHILTNYNNSKYSRNLRRMAFRRDGQRSNPKHSDVYAAMQVIKEYQDKAGSRLPAVTPYSSAKGLGGSAHRLQLALTLTSGLNGGRGAV